MRITWRVRGFLADSGETRNEQSRNLSAPGSFSELARARNGSPTPPAPAAPPQLAIHDGVDELRPPQQVAVADELLANVLLARLAHALGVTRICLLYTSDAADE